MVQSLDDGQRHLLVAMVIYQNPSLIGIQVDLLESVITPPAYGCVRLIP